MDTDITSFRVAATGLATGARSRVRGIYMAVTAVGSVEFRNGSIGGELKIMLDVTAAGSADVILPGRGVLFPDGVFIVITGGVSGVTLFCG